MLSVYLSPHLDDAVFSCGGRIALARARRRRQRVITIFAGVPRGISGVPDTEVAYVERRRAEDFKALGALGVEEIVHLDLLDAIYRVGPDGAWLYDAAAMCGRVHPRDRADAKRIAQRVRERLPDAGRVEIFAPLGVGGHVDHQVTHRAAKGLAAAGYCVRYYEDLPYAFEPDRLRAALSRKKSWKSDACELDESHLDRKLAAIGHYRSQVPALFGDADRMGRQFREHGFVERTWSPAQ